MYLMLSYIYFSIFGFYSKHDVVRLISQSLEMLLYFMQLIFIKVFL